MKNKEKMWALLVHMGPWGAKGFKDFRFDEELWDYIVEEAANTGLNTIVLDICGGIDFASHPEITLEGAWTRTKLRKELNRCREKGITLIPKLNFATIHDVWLGEYHYMVSTPKYYQVCNDLIKEAYELFDHPEYIHLGMDEEDEMHARRSAEGLAVYRKGELFWHDLRFFIDSVKDTGAKPWIWSCPLFEHPEEYKAHIDADEAILSPWYYDAFRRENWTHITKRQVYVDYYRQEDYAALNIQYVEEDPFNVKFRKVALPLMEEGYEYVPCTSTANENDLNAEELMLYFKESGRDDQILGYITAPWKLTLMEHKEKFERSFRLLKEARAKIYGE
ncbi:MAG: hypothetical protein IJN99_02430 [Clostridia bacterium]|nr:hypothetical protein [Clostridia bacterium]